MEVYNKIRSIKNFYDNWNKYVLKFSKKCQLGPKYNKRIYLRKLCLKTRNAHLEKKCKFGTDINIKELVSYVDY